MQITNNGTGVYYKPGIPLNDDLQVLADIGIHFDNSQQSLSIFGSENKYRSIFFDIAAGIRCEFFKENNCRNLSTGYHIAIRQFSRYEFL